MRIKMEDLTKLMKEVKESMTLREGEEVIWSGKPALKTGFTIILFILTWYSLFIPILWILKVRRTRYALTNQRVWMETGIIGRSTRSVEWGKITDIGTHMGVMGRLWNYGGILFQTAGAPGPEIVFRWVKDHEDAARLAEEQLRETQ